MQCFGWQAAQQPWDTALKMVSHTVKFIGNTMGRRFLLSSAWMPAFFDRKLLQAFDDLGLGVICSGRIYEDIQNFAERARTFNGAGIQNRQQAWDYLEYGDRRGSWDTFRRAILCRPVVTGQQRLLAFARPLSIYYTNLGMGDAIDQRLVAVGREQACVAENIIAMAHSRAPMNWCTAPQGFRL